MFETVHNLDFLKTDIPQQSIFSSIEKISHFLKNKIPIKLKWLQVIALHLSLKINISLPVLTVTYLSINLTYYNYITFYFFRTWYISCNNKTKNIQRQLTT